MVTLFCRLKKIGGISGKRIQITRVKQIELIPYNKGYGNNIKDCIKDWTLNEIERFCMILENSSDTLKVKNEIIDLDLFMELMKLQGDILNELYDNLVLLEYNGGEVIKFGLITIKEVLNKIGNIHGVIFTNLVFDDTNSIFQKNPRWGFNERIIDLNSTNFQFTLNGLRAQII